MCWIEARMRERTTWRGLALVLSAAVVVVSADLVDSVFLAVSAIFGVYDVFSVDGKK